MIDKLSAYLHAEPKKSMVGLFLALFSLIIFWVCYQAWLSGVLFFLLFAALGPLRLSTHRRTVRFASYILWSAVCIAAAVLFPLYEIYTDRIWQVMKQYTPASSPAVNALIFLIFSLLLYALTGKWRTSLSVTISLLSALVIVNGYIYRLRGKEFLFSDIFAAKTALNVAGQYSLSVPLSTFTAVMVLVLLLFAGSCLPAPKPAGIRARLAGAMAGLALLGLFLPITRDMNVITWNSDGTLMHGYHVNLYLSIRDYFVDPPEVYSEDYIASLETEYPAPGEEDQFPNILIIMNESYADLRVFGSELNTNIPVTPYLDSLEDNIIRGNALTSVYGGGTANAEFECLSGFSMQFFPASSTPYQQYIHDQSHSLAWVLKSLGYDAMATHPYLASGWSRPTVYPLYGFERITFIEDYPCQNLVREYVSDQEMYEYMLTQLDAAEDAPLFLFGITMQNHGGYGVPMPNYTQTVFLEGYQQAYPQAEEYLTLLNYSDQALEYLLTELSAYPEDTIVLFFGDHLPGIEKSFYEELYGGSFETLDSQMLQYTVPFFIWANYDIAEQNIPCTSLNYLGRYLLEAAGIPLPPYYQFLKEAESVIPAVSALGYYSNSAQSYLPCQEAQGEEALWLARYEALQYNALFDRNGLSEHFFGSHIGS